MVSGEKDYSATVIYTIRICLFLKMSLTLDKELGRALVISIQLLLYITAEKEEADLRPCSLTARASFVSDTR